jgi:uncharacterized membrane protein|tara:strand:+ start:61 stop:651 length:591 start_codon:yes stop_codon:yes gene_type:complete
MNKTKSIKKLILDKITTEKKGFKIQGIDENNLLKTKLELSNRKISTIIFLFIIILIIFNALGFITEYNSQNFNFGMYFFNNIYYILISLVFLIYFLIKPINYYNIKINKHSINIKIYRIFIDLLTPKSHINVSSELLTHYYFYNRSFSFNKSLMLQIKTNEEEIVKKNFNLSFLSKMDEQKIKRFLQKIINQNKLK